LLGRDRQLVEMRQDNLPWDTIVQKLQRAQAVCDHRLRYLRKKGNVTFAPSTSYWTAEKDRELTRYRSELRLSWRQIAEHFPGWSPAYLGQRFRNIKRPKIYYRPWTTEENEKLKHLCSGLQLSWEQIAEHFPGRTVGAVARQFRRCSDGCNYWTAEEEAEVIRLRSELQLSWKEIAERLGRTTFAIQVRCVKLDAKVRPCTYGWTAEQDRELIRLRTELGLPWDQIAERMPGRSPATIHKRCVKLGVRHYWSAEEDRELMRLHSELRLPWKQIAERFPHRTITVIKKRAQVLSRKLRTRIWTPEEDRELLRLHSELQLDWRQIAERFPGRTARAVEQRGSKVLGVRWSGNPSWDAERERELIRLRSELKLPWAQVTERIGGSIASVSHRFYKLQKHIGVAS
jgi:DNA-directed RNA polymerase specialized sigma24 family protein